MRGDEAAGDNLYIQYVIDLIEKNDRLKDKSIKQLQEKGQIDGGMKVIIYLVFY